MHLLCYGIVKKPDEIFIIGNMVMLCDECLDASKEFISPKRKQPNSASLVQRTIDVHSPMLSLSKTASNGLIPQKTVSTTAQSTKQMNLVIETLAQKIETHTATLAGLKNSVDSMSDVISHQNVAVRESIKLSNENSSSIKETLRRTSEFPRSVNKNSYANVLKSHNNSSGIETPKSSKSHFTRTPKSNTPAVSGTSNNSIGKPLSPKQFRTSHQQKDRQNAAPKREKAVWVSGIHRDTTEAEMISYITDNLGIVSTDKFDVRKLVKKDKELSTYSFISFKVSCSVDIFNVLIDPTKWPRNTRIREFDLERKSSSGIKLTQQRSPDTEEPPIDHGTTNRIVFIESQRNNDQSKNDQEPPIANMETETTH